MPGISRQAVQRTVGVHAQRHVRQIGAGDRDGAGGAHAFDDRRIDGATALASAGTPQVVGRPAMSMFSFTVKGTPCSGPMASPEASRLVGLYGRSARLVGQHAHHGIQRRVHRIDTRQMGIHHFHRTQLPARNALRQFSGRELPDLAHRLLQHDMRDEIARNAPARRSRVAHPADVDGMTSGRPLAAPALANRRRMRIERPSQTSR